MTMLDVSCSKFVDELSSKAPVPGGGGAAALGGAIGMALSNMVGNLTVGKKKYADVEEEVKDLIEKGQLIINELEELVDKDAEVFEPCQKLTAFPRIHRKKSGIKQKQWKNVVKPPVLFPWRL